MLTSKVTRLGNEARKSKSLPEHHVRCLALSDFSTYLWGYIVQASLLFLVVQGSPSPDRRYIPGQTPAEIAGIQHICISAGKRREYRQSITRCPAVLRVLRREGRLLEPVTMHTLIVLVPFVSGFAVGIFLARYRGKFCYRSISHDLLFTSGVISTAFVSINNVGYCG